MKRIFVTFLLLVAVVGLAYLGIKFSSDFYENRTLKQIISRLEADSRIAEVLVTDVKQDSKTNTTHTTIKFLEYDVAGEPLAPRYFTFSGNVIQFQSLVIRFNDAYIRQADALKGKSAYLFWKVFMLDGAHTQEYEITKAYQVPEGYKVGQQWHPFERELWKQFWEVALEPDKAEKLGIKNAQIEAPGTKFVPGVLYTIHIEHDGGMRIDVTKLPDIIRGEKIPG